MYKYSIIYCGICVNVIVLVYYGIGRAFIDLIDSAKVAKWIAMKVKRQ